MHGEPLAARLQRIWKERQSWKRTNLGFVRKRHSVAAPALPRSHVALLDADQGAYDSDLAPGLVQIVLTSGSGNGLFLASDNNDARHDRTSYRVSCTSDHFVPASRPDYILRLLAWHLHRAPKRLRFWHSIVIGILCQRHVRLRSEPNLGLPELFHVNPLG